ncbi:hypothetical protein GY45DRAFT_1371045 [Cubamyces sp. BRFM 1775]|nr:hypothetical protein GY45DRAFT_1371045 [Cubamyces sp. BRFM 1775]
MATQQQQNTAVHAVQNNPQPAAQRGNEENIPPGPLPSVNNPQTGVTRTTLGPFNGPLAPVPNTTPFMPFDGHAVADWPFRGPEGPLRRTRIEGNDELVSVDDLNLPLAVAPDVSGATPPINILTTSND